MQQALTISIVSQSGNQPVTLIMLEQVAYPSCTGQVSKADLVRYLANLMFGKNDPLGVDCGVDASENLNILVNAYPYVPDLNYKLHASYGTLSPAVIAEIEVKETIQLQLQEEINSKYPVHKIVSAKWLNQAYDKSLQQIPSPAITIGPNYKTVKSAIPCYGSVQITYTTIVHSSTLTIPKRAVSNENKYSSTVYAVYDGGLVWLQVEPPSAVDITGGDCAYGGTNLKLNDHPVKDPKPSGTGANREIRINYCTQKQLSDTVYGI